ncbi:hypothetical protein AB0D94_19800 [Streptomyces sp. NPDC048255]|uniref:hypothetical protein n=1 Tax=Streptomyces sp. NPDC048255 TaxID=3154713 RepID=UPI0034097578
MVTHTLRRRMSALATVLGLGIALPFALGATPASAAAQIDITKTHSGSFPRGGQGVYTLTVTNTGDQTTVGGTIMQDTIQHEGVTFVQGETVIDSDVLISCAFEGDNRINCDSDPLGPGEGYTLTLTVNVAEEGPCLVDNFAVVLVPGSNIADRVNDPTTITGGTCGGGDGDGDGDGGPVSILPVNLNGVIPMFNNITTNNNINSPDASNVSRQDFGLNAP